MARTIACFFVFFACWPAFALPPGVEPIGSYYARKGDRIYLLERAEGLFTDSGQLDVLQSGHTKVISLRNVDDAHFRLIGSSQSYATDGRFVWCGGRDPIGTAAETKDLGGGFFAVGKTLQFACGGVTAVNRDGSAHGVGLDGFELLSCSIVRFGSRIYSATTGSRLSELQILDPATFTINRQCNASDARARYQFNTWGQMTQILPLPGKGIAAANRYSIVEGVAYFGVTPVAGADTDSFEPLSADCLLPYAKDARHAYSEAEVIPNADPSKFSCIAGTHLAKDAHSVYVRRAVSQLDAATLEVLAVPGCPPNFAKDSRAVYVIPNLEAVADADPRTFVVLGARRRCAAAGRDARHVFWGPKVVEGADLATITVLTELLMFDANRPYWSGSPISRKDPRYIEARIPTVRLESSNYAKLDGVVYSGTKAIEGADAGSFRALPGGYAADAARAYYGPLVIEGADASTFRLVPCFPMTYAADAVHVYFGLKVIEGEVGATFNCERALARDRELALHRDREYESRPQPVGPRFAEVDGKKVEWFAGRCQRLFARDAQRVYDRRLNPIASADPATFVVLSGIDSNECLEVGSDGLHVFWSGRTVDGADVKTFRLLSHGFAYDAKRVYRYGEVLTTPYPAEYEVLRRREATLKQHPGID